MEMRPYRPEDLETVVNIANAAWQPIRQMTRAALGDTISDIFHPAGDAVSKGLEVQAQIASNEYLIAVCEHENKVVGFITGKVSGVLGEICNNAADRTANLKGIGQTMYKYMLDEFKRSGVRVVKVLTGLDDAHAPARRAYERAGFKRRLESVTYFMELD